MDKSKESQSKRESKYLESPVLHTVVDVKSPKVLIDYSYRKVHARTAGCVQVTRHKKQTTNNK